jgi:hypothetical protein
LRANGDCHARLTEMCSRPAIRSTRYWKLPLRRFSTTAIPSEGGMPRAFIISFKRIMLHFRLEVDMSSQKSRCIARSRPASGGQIASTSAETVQAGVLGKRDEGGLGELDGVQVGELRYCRGGHHIFALSTNKALGYSVASTLGSSAHHQQSAGIDHCRKQWPLLG